MELVMINEFQIRQETSLELNSLLKRCFPDTEYGERDHFKQLPHCRILARQNGKLIGQVGIDFRVMNLNNDPVNVFGVIDLCVDLDFQGQGVGKALLAEFERVAKSNSSKVDFLFLVTDTPKFYEGLGFTITDITPSWLKIDGFKNLGIGNEKIHDAFFLVKRISSKQWKDGALDLLGYMY